MRCTIKEINDPQFEKEYLKMKELQWFKEAKYGLMVHFGLYSVLGGVYKGKRSGAYAEWIQATHAISYKRRI
jgi:hypothetical protein